MEEKDMQKDIIYIKTLLEEKFGEQGIIQQILNHAQTTNGRVDKAEANISMLKKHLYLGVGGLGAIAFIIQLFI